MTWNKLRLCGKGLGSRLFFNISERGQETRRLKMFYPEVESVLLVSIIVSMAVSKKELTVPRFHIELKIPY